MKDTQTKPWLYRLRSSESFVILVVSIAIFTVSSAPDTPISDRIAHTDQDVFIYGMVNRFGPTTELV